MLWIHQNGRILARWEITSAILSGVLSEQNWPMIYCTKPPQRLQKLLHVHHQTADKCDYIILQYKAIYHWPSIHINFEIRVLPVSRSMGHGYVPFDGTPTVTLTMSQSIMRMNSAVPEPQKWLSGFSVCPSLKKYTNHMDHLVLGWAFTPL